MTETNFENSQNNFTQPEALLVVITKVDIKFWDLVGLFVKSSIAVIPAIIILFLLGVLCFLILSLIGVMV